jgi:predicted transcriptional regulator
MDHLNFEQPCTEEVSVDAATLAKIDEGLQAVEEGRTVSLEEVRKMIPEWFSKFESLKQR